MERMFDPAHHDSHVIALFTDEAGAEQARAAVVAAGVPASQVEVMADGEALHGGQFHPVQDLFVPEDDYHDYHHALGRGHALIIVRPSSVEALDAAVAALENAAPLSLEEHGRNWQGKSTAPVTRMTINHTNVSRADMYGRAIGGRDEVILDMTGQKMTVRIMSEAEMAEAPFAPPQSPEHRPAPLAPPPPARNVPVQGTSYTYGVPAEIVRRMSPDEQVMAQPHTVEVTGDKTTRGTFLRVVDGRTRVGWRAFHPTAARVRSYVTERPADAVS
jgi:hypothetical protein